MNNMLGLAPLLGVAPTLSGALLLIAITLSALLLTSVAAWSMRNVIAESMRTLIATILVASAAGCGQLVALAFAYNAAHSLEFLLPLTASNILLFAHLVTILRGGFTSMTTMARATLTIMGGTAATWSIIGALAHFSGSDNVLPWVFIAAALLIALHHYLTARLQREPSPIAPVARKRQRVTGPLR